MGDLHRPLLPVARLLVVTLGLLGFVAGATGSGTQGGASSAGASSTGTISAVRTWVVEHASARGRTSGKPRAGGEMRSPSTAITKITAVTRQIVVDAPDVQPALALPAAGAVVRPPSLRVIRPRASAPTEHGAAPGGAPRGRAPPASTRI